MPRPSFTKASQAQQFVIKTQANVFLIMNMTTRALTTSLELFAPDSLALQLNPTMPTLILSKIWLGGGWIHGSLILQKSGFQPMLLIISRIRKVFLGIRNLSTSEVWSVFCQMSTITTMLANLSLLLNLGKCMNTRKSKQKPMMVTTTKLLIVQD